MGTRRMSGFAFVSLIAMIWAGGVLSAADKLTITSHQDGVRVKAGEPITIEGQHPISVSSGDSCWVFLKDGTGGLYLQTPNVELLGEDFIAENIRPGSGIKAAIFVAVTKSGHDRLKAWARQERFGKIDEDEVKAVPGGIRELGRLKMVVED